MPNPARYLVSVALFALAACQDSTTELEQEGVAEAAAITSNTWQQRARMPSDRRFVMTATVEPTAGSSFLYAIGGQSMNDDNWCSGHLSKVQAYDGNTNTWTTKAPLPFPTYGGLVGVVNGRIYVIGACGESNLVWEYTVATNQWRQKTSAPMSLPGPVGSVVAGKIYLFAYCPQEACLYDPSFPSGREQYTFFGYYDPASDKWVRRPLPPLSFWPSVAATFNGKLYFLDAQGQLHIYTPTTGVWTTGARQGTQELASLTTAVVRGKWYVVGRERSGAIFLSVYDPAANRWVKRATPPAAYLSDWSNGPSAGRVWANGVARLELVGGMRPNNNWQYTP